MDSSWSTTAASSKLRAALSYSSINVAAPATSCPTAGATGGPPARLANIFQDLGAATSDAQRPFYIGTLSPERMSAMDAHARACPAAEARSIPALAAYLCSAARNAEEKVRAICFWLHLNVRYDTESYFGGNVRSMSADDVLRERSSVCHGFARLMAALCEASGVECKVIDGYAKGYSWRTSSLGSEAPRYKSNHNWNAVKLSTRSAGRERWFLVDPTWCAGGLSAKGRDKAYQAKWEPAFYMVDPLAFAQSHFPGDPSWTLLPESQRPSWEAFVAAVRLVFPACWDAGILPVTHRRASLPAAAVEEDGGRLRVVLRQRKGAFVFATVNDGPNVYPSLLPRQASGDGDSELVAFEFKGITSPSGSRGSCGGSSCGSGGGSNSDGGSESDCGSSGGGGGGGEVSLKFFASLQRYSTYGFALEYVMAREA